MSDDTVKLGEVLGGGLPRMRKPTGITAPPSERTDDPERVRRYEFFRRRISENIYRALAHVGVPPHYQKARLEDFPPAIVKSVDDFPNTPGLLVTGECGRGKTWLAAATLTEALLTMPDFFITGTGFYPETFDLNARWVSMPTLLADVRASFNSEGGPTERQLMTACLKPHVLVLDDLLGGYVTDWALSAAYPLIEGRMAAGKSTLVTLHKGLTSLYRTDAHLASRLSAFDHIHLEGRDRRPEKRRGPHAKDAT